MTLETKGAHYTCRVTMCDGERFTLMIHNLRDILNLTDLQLVWAFLAHINH